MTAGLRESEVPLAEAFPLALIDLDGVVYRGPDAVEHAATSLDTARAFGMSIVFVTNNASREPATVAAQLNGLGISTVADEVMTSAQAAAALLDTRLAPGAKVLVVGGAGLHTAVREAGFAIVRSADDEPAAVVQGYDASVSWTELAEAAYAIERGAWHVASNVDLTIPTERGIAPGNGSLVAVVKAATGVTPDAAGKPSPTMYRLAVERAGAQTALVVGDRLDTDLAGARSGGYPGLHVLTGVSGPRDVILAPPALRPDFVGTDLRCLLTPHPTPVLVDTWWTCGRAAARWTDGRMEIADGAVTIDTLRVCAAAAWEAADRGRPIAPADAPTLEALAH